MVGNFNPQRLTLARRKNGLTKARLAEMVGLSVRTITRYESGVQAPEGDTLITLARAVGFPVAFFFLPHCDEPNLYGVSFRALKTLTASQRGAALASGALAMEVSDWIEDNFVLPDTDVPDLRDQAPEIAAAALRKHWGVGIQPIGNALHLLESKGVRLFSLIEQCREVDAYSFWRGRSPFIFLNTTKSSERVRFDCMHELGHLVLHRHHGVTGSREAEREADAFASAMLMPPDDVIARAPRMPTLRHLIQAKKRWVVSVAALNYRMHALGLLSDWHYRTLCIQIAEHGYRTNEPDSAPNETSQVLKKVFALSRQDGMTRAIIANALCLSMSDLEALVFGLVMTSIGGGGESAGWQAAASAPKDHLRLVVE